MTRKNNQPNPDDRSDNVEKSQEKVIDTIENIEASHETLGFAPDEQREKIKAKNKRREEAIKGMRKEIKDEHRHDLQEG